MKSPREFLQQYVIENGITQISAHEVVELASDPENPMHSWFQWDDLLAGQQHRLWQARQLIASLKITREDRPDAEIRMFVSVPFDREGGKSYQLVTEAMKSPRSRLALQKEMQEKVQYWREQSELLSLPVQGWLESFPEEEFLPHMAMPAGQEAVAVGNL